MATVQRAVGALQPTDNIPVPPDVLSHFLMTGGSSAQSADYPTGAQIMRITPYTTAGGSFFCFLCPGSTSATVASSGTTQSSAASSGVSSIPIPFQLSMQIPGGSTGYSVAAYTSGVVSVEFWKK